MTIANRIIDYAGGHHGCFSRRDLMVGLNSEAKDVLEASVHVTLERMLKENRIVRTGCGEYKLADGFKPLYRCETDDEIRSLSKIVKEKFPFVDFCVWRSSAFTPFMQHIPSSDVLFVDVEREAMESVFLYLQSFPALGLVLFNPSKLECGRYMANNKCMVVRVLVKEAPMQTIGETPTPTLEKLLVDAVGDKELSYLQGAESFHIFRNAFSRYEINTKRLLRYASRRNRKDKVQTILNDLGLEAV